MFRTRAASQQLKVESMAQGKEVIRPFILMPCALCLLHAPRLLTSTQCFGNKKRPFSTPTLLTTRGEQCFLKQPKLIARGVRCERRAFPAKTQSAPPRPNENPCEVGETNPRIMTESPSAPCLVTSAQFSAMKKILLTTPTLLRMQALHQYEMKKE